MSVRVGEQPGADAEEPDLMPSATTDEAATTKWWALGVASVALVVGAFLLYADRKPDPEAIAISLEWARLLPLPVGARNVKTEVTGNPFTRGFIVQFSAPEVEIRDWLSQSPGTRAVDPAQRRETYNIQPGGGAGFAEVKVDWKAGQVTIRTYWS